MSVMPAIVAQLRRFDDEAWAALANRGLLRRAAKDLESVAVQVVEDGPVLVVEVGDRRVTFPEAGPARATCSCPSATTCQHVITAGLWLAKQVADDPARGAPQVRRTEAPGTEVPGTETPDTEAAGPEGPGPAGPGPEGASPVADEGEALRAELLSIGLDALVTHVGPAGVRWAAQFVTDLDDGARVGGGRHTTIAFATPTVTFRYMGGGLAGLMADRRLPSLERYQVAAVLAYQRAHGLVLEAPAARTRTVSRELPQRESRSRLRGATQRLLLDTVRVGVSHLSPSIHERYTTLATWAQGAEYHRLALLLRRLADQVELLLTRSARADEHRLLDETALAFGLVTALTVADARGEAPKDLVGQARSTYEAVRSLELVGLGGVPWRTGSGYQGLTVLFWSPSASAFFSWTDARPATMTQFDPRVRWTAPGPWSGLASPSATTGRRVTLVDAQVSTGGRISGVDRTSATTQPLDVATLVSLLPVRDSWAEAAQIQDPTRRSLLDPPAPLESWAVLRPASFGSPAFDVARQTLRWPLTDVAGAVLLCEVPFSAQNAHLIERVEALRDLPEGALVVARLRTAPHGLVAEPLSLLLEARGAGAGLVDALHFAPVPREQRGRVSKIVAGLRRRQDAGAPPEDVAPLVNLPRPLVELRGWLEAQAERGVSGVAEEVVLGALNAHHGKLREAGLRVFAPSPPGLEPAEALMRSHFLVLQVTLALTGEQAP